VAPEDIKFVVSTHGHSDHIGNNNLFLNAIHIVGTCVSDKHVYFLHDFSKGEINHLILEFS
jgi:glyoxylase-like metal-dependent hydrolase (beta-lactamase superfamily II)